MENIQLLPCPFCDHKAEFRLSPQMKWHYVSCTIPYCVGEVHPDRCCPTETKEAAAIRWNTRASGWVSVADEVPNEYPQPWVLVCDVLGNRREARYLPNWQNFQDRSGHLFHDVTHWQPLPQPPKQ